MTRDYARAAAGAVETISMQIAIYRRGAVVAQAVIDNDDAALVAGRWKLQGTTANTRYAIRYNAEKRLRGESHTEYLHRVIMGAPPFEGAQVDHVNGDTLDCRRANMRWVTLAQNTQNRRVSSRSLTGIRGVSRCRKSGGYFARVCKRGGVEIYRKRFATLEEATAAVVRARKELLPFAAA